MNPSANRFTVYTNFFCIVFCYGALFYSLYQAHCYMEAKDTVMAIRYDVLAVFFAIYICWMDITRNLKKLEEKIDAKSNGG